MADVCGQRHWALQRAGGALQMTITLDEVVYDGLAGKSRPICD